mmetsp:Transcript_9535/g.31368  ORF Transcript_9535/g.31368 Transcript_9535/m.31368 type:complete len:400 (+) Transcript_9535:441-1640(+)
MEASRAVTAAEAAPLLVPLTADLTAWEGFVAVETDGVEFELALEGIPRGAGEGCGPPPPAPEWTGARLVSGPELAAVLGEEAGAALQQRLSSGAAASVGEFMLELRHVVARRLRLCSGGGGGGGGAPFISNAGVCARVLADLEGVGWERVARVAPDLASATLRVRDRAGREHDFEVAFGSGYPLAAPVVTADLPVPVQIRWGRDSTLVDVLEQCSRALEPWEEVWDVLSELDTTCRVLEPPLPAPRSALHRRLALGSSVVLALEVAPAAPRSAPAHLRLFGPEPAVAPLRQRLSAALLELWDAAAGLRANLERALGQALPGPPTAASSAGNDDADCGVCYAQRLPGTDELPELACNTCGRLFHRACLAEWLQSDAGARRAFRTLFGTCPYCSGPITVTL